MRYLEKGKPAPLGASWDGTGVNFAVYSGHASAVFLCLFDAASGAETARLALPACQDGVWHGYVPGLGPGQRYAFRADGPFRPSRGQRFNVHKLLVDPYARALDGHAVWHPSHQGSQQASAARRDERDSAATMPRCLVIDPRFDWRQDRPPGIGWEDTVIYETHVKGMTALHPQLPPAQRGCFLGLASEPVLDHLRALGVTAIELLPVHQSYVERHLVEGRRTNYWGYAPVATFAPDIRLASSEPGRQVDEFKTMVRRVHEAGMEVLLDVVYNHSGEGDECGPTVCLRGLDNAAYYRLEADQPGEYVDVTGCGNTLNLDHPRTLDLVLDSLRYWVSEMHVDGFRFDLATTLTRDQGVPDVHGRFLSAVACDPVLAGVKLIAEPWDAAPDGNLEGAFPAGWSEWNGRYRGGVRRFWRGDANTLGELATRISGSSDLFAERGPCASINFVTSHDGFTLRDLVSYEHKHNEANGEDNRDGSDENWARNFGVEGPSNDPEVRRRRARAVRTFLATLALSRGVPMLLHGDEMGRSQAGNNNAYCRDDETSWMNWNLDDEARATIAFTRDVFALRRRHRVLRANTFYRGPHAPGGQVRDIIWYRSDGTEMEGVDWHTRRSVAIVVNDTATASPPGVAGDTLLILLNGDDDALRFGLPTHRGGARGWRVLVDTGDDHAHAVALGTATVAPGPAPAVEVPAGGLVVLVPVESAA